MIPIPPGLIAPVAGALIAVAALGGSYFKGRSDANGAWEAKAAESQIEAMKTEAEWTGALDRVRKQHEEEKSLVQSRLNIALNGLRDRPAVRLPEAARAACAGATGAELSRPDAIVLTRLAARADTIRADLEACRSYIDTVRK